MSLIIMIPGFYFNTALPSRLSQNKTIPHYFSCVPAVLELDPYLKAFPATVERTAFTTVHPRHGQEEIKPVMYFFESKRDLSLKAPIRTSCARLVSAVLAEISDEWLTSRTYLSFKSSD